jgi:hypothetical protein
MRVASSSYSRHVALTSGHMTTTCALISHALATNTMLKTAADVVYHVRVLFYRQGSPAEGHLWLAFAVHL